MKHANMPPFFQITENCAAEFNPSFVSVLNYKKEKGLSTIFFVSLIFATPLATSGHCFDAPNCKL